MSSPTRGFGVLESWLSQKRADMARYLLGDACNGLRFLDIGCGIPPAFLLSLPAGAGSKTGIDLRAGGVEVPGIAMIDHDCSSTMPLPCASNSADVATVLAVVEHLPPDRVLGLLKDIHRVLCPGGRVIITTPAPHARLILTMLSALHMVSKQEIADHRQLYSTRELHTLLSAGGFSDTSVRSGTFELGLNIWCMARKEG